MTELYDQLGSFDPTESQSPHQSPAKLILALCLISLISVVLLTSCGSYEPPPPPTPTPMPTPTPTPLPPGRALVLGAVIDLAGCALTTLGLLLFTVFVFGLYHGLQSPTLRELDDESAWGVTFYHAINTVREKLGLSPVWLVPHDVSEKKLAAHAGELWATVAKNLKAAPKTGNTPLRQDAYRALRQQAREVPDNIVRSLWRLHRLRHIRATLIKPGQTASVKPLLERIDSMESGLIKAMQTSLEVLQSVPVSLLEVEFAVGDKSLDRLLSKLSDANKRMTDLASSYDDLKQMSGGS